MTSPLRRPLPLNSADKDTRCAVRVGVEGGRIRSVEGSPSTMMVVVGGGGEVVVRAKMFTFSRSQVSPIH